MGIERVVAELGQYNIGRLEVLTLDTKMKWSPSLEIFHERNLKGVNVNIIILCSILHLLLDLIIDHTIEALDNMEVLVSVVKNSLTLREDVECEHLNLVRVVPLDIEARNAFH